MHGFTEHELLGTFLAIATLLFAARGMAELTRRLGQPEVLGELLGGFLIGPSILGAIFPATFRLLFLNGTVSHSLQLLSWIGAILLLMIAGMEADLDILREKAVPGLLAAGGAIGSALAIGTWIGLHSFGVEPTGAFFLGIVLSVTAVSVVAKLLIEREALRRDYAQVMLAAGIAAEVVVWPMISVVSSVQHRANPLVAGTRATLLAVGFFAFMLTVGRRFTFWAMRRVADVTAIANGELSLVLVLLAVAASATTAMGLHPLLGAFVFGVILSKAPRATTALKERIQALTIALFAPIFFGLAGMRVNLFELRGWTSIRGILVVFLLAGLVKTLFGFLGARAGRLPVWEAATVGVGLNLKGGTDVVVAIVGTELLLFSPDLYTMYAVVAILTVVVSPPILNWMAAKTTPGDLELKRLNREEARELAYLADMERVLLPMVPELLPALTARVIAAMAAGKGSERELFDITEFRLGEDTSLEQRDTPDTVIYAGSTLAHAADAEHVRVDRFIATEEEDLFAAICRASDGQQLIAIGAPAVSGELALSFGPLQDRILREIRADILVTVAATEDLGDVPASPANTVLPQPDNLPDLVDAIAAPRRILVPINGLGHSLAAADVAAYLAKGFGAEVVLMSIVAPRLGPLFWRERKHRDLLQAGYTITREAEARVARLDIPHSDHVVIAADPAEAVLAELNRQPYQLLVLGAVMRSSEAGISLGGTAERLLSGTAVPRVLLVSRNADQPGG